MAPGIASQRAAAAASAFAAASPAIAAGRLVMGTEDGQLYAFGRAAQSHQRVRGPHPHLRRLVPQGRREAIRSELGLSGNTVLGFIGSFYALVVVRCLHGCYHLFH